jgi:hypothetical protein
MLQNMAAKTSLALIDQSKKIFQTKISGKATIATQILEGTPGKIYHFQFQSQGMLSQKTQPFLLKNHIVKVNFADSADFVKLAASASSSNDVLDSRKQRKPEASSQDE